MYASSVFADLDQNQPPSIFARIGAADQLDPLAPLRPARQRRFDPARPDRARGDLLAFVIYRLRGVAGARRCAAPPENLPPPAMTRTASGSSRSAAAQRGDYREAIRRAFRSALLDVADRRAHLDRAWTTREMLATLSSGRGSAGGGRTGRGVIRQSLVRRQERWAPPTGRSLARDARRCGAWPATPQRATKPVSRPPLSAMLTLIAALCILAVIAISSAIPPNDQRIRRRDLPAASARSRSTRGSPTSGSMSAGSRRASPHRRRHRLLLRPDGRAHHLGCQRR